MFRDPEVWEALHEHLKNKISSYQSEVDFNGEIMDVTPKIFRAWSVGCATGEEVHSLAHVLNDVFSGNKISQKSAHSVKWSVYGTDVSEESLNTAKNTIDFGVKNKIDINSKPENFSEKIHFKVHNVIEESPLKAMSLILCRNVLMFMKREYQEAVLMKLYESLRTGGILVIGKSEHVKGDAEHLFKTIDHRKNIFEKIT